MPRKLRRIKRDRQLQLAVFIPVLAAAAAAAQTYLPEIKDAMSPWAYFGVSIAVSAIVAALHLKAHPDTDDECQGCPCTCKDGK